MHTDYLYFLLYLLGYALCSGANVGFFAFSERDLRRKIQRGEESNSSEKAKVEAKRALTIKKHLEDPNWTLAAILLTNVGFGVQLSQLSDSIFTGILAVLMPVIAITVFGEFFSQATFLRFAGPICSLTSPVIWLLKIVTAPFSWPLARAVDALYGREALGRLNEKDLLADLEMELRDNSTGDELPHDETLDKRELTILMNVAKADDEQAAKIGNLLDPRSIIRLPFAEALPVFPDDLEKFAQKELQDSEHPWFVIFEDEEPRYILDADGFVRALYSSGPSDLYPYEHCFRIRSYDDPEVQIGQIVSDLYVHEEHGADDVIDVDVVLVKTELGWRIITGGDILGRFLRGVAGRKHWRQSRVRRQGGKTAPA